MKVEVISYTPDPDKTCLATRLECDSHKASKEIMKLGDILLGNWFER